MNFFNRILDFKKRLEKPLETLNNIHISESAILSNFDFFKSLHPNWSIFPVLKSNAYWHWISEIAKILSKRKLDYICVDSFYEALKVRKFNNTPILLIWYTLPVNLANMDFSFVTLTVYDKDSILELSKINKKIKIHLKIDSWMNRQWVRFEEIKELLDLIKKTWNIDLEWLMTHFSDADNVDNSYSLQQEAYFKKCFDLVRSEGFRIKYIHWDNTAAWVKWFCRTFANSSRLWIGLYWVNPFEKQDWVFDSLNALKPALSLESTIVLRKSISKGDKVSYNWTFIAEKDLDIWIIPVWYYEALSRKLSNKFFYTYKGTPLRLLWRVCMNLTVIDLTWTDLHVWDKICVISDKLEDKNNIYELSRLSETIPYECFTRLSETIRRNITK